MRNWKKVVAMFSVGVLALSLAAFGGAKEAKADDPISIYFIPKNLGNPYFEAISAGFQDAIKDFPEGTFTYEMVGPATAEATSQIEYVEAAVQNGADVIFIAANSNDALNSTFDDARDAGTKIVIINQDIPGSEDHRDVAIQPCDFSLVGIELLDHVKSLIGEGKFAVLSATTDAPDQNTWIEGMQDLLANDDSYAGLELVDIVYGDDQPEKSTTEMEALLAKHSDLDCVVAPTTVGIAAAAKVLQTQGAGGESGVQLTGLGLPSEMAEFVLDDTVSEFKLWDPPAEGRIAVYMAYEMVVNGWEPAEGASYEAGDDGTITLNENNVVYTIPALLTFNKDNIEEYAAQF